MEFPEWTSTVGELSKIFHPLPHFTLSGKGTSLIILSPDYIFVYELFRPGDPSTVSVYIAELERVLKKNIATSGD